MTTQTFPAPAAADTPILEVLKIWQQAEPGRYPLKFGNLTWGRDTPEDHTKSLTFEFAAAIDALAQRGWSFDLNVNMAGETTAQVAYAPGRVATASDTDPLGALIRATVFALSVQVRKERSGGSQVLAVSFAGTPLTSNQDLPNATRPAEDIRVWSRIEPHRFNEGARHITSPLYRGAGGSVLAPVFRGMIVLQYVTAPAVFESAGLHGWTTRLTGSVGGTGQTVYRAEVTLTDGCTGSAAYPTPGPASVKAYLAALKINSGGELSLTPHPKDRFSHPLVVVHTDKEYRYTLASEREPRWASTTGTFAVFNLDLHSFNRDLPDDLVILDREPTVQEIEMAVASGILPPV